MSFIHEEGCFIAVKRAKLIQTNKSYFSVTDSAAGGDGQGININNGYTPAALNMNGGCLTLLRLDEELTHALDYPA